MLVYIDVGHSLFWAFNWLAMGPDGPMAPYLYIYIYISFYQVSYLVLSLQAFRLIDEFNSSAFPRLCRRDVASHQCSHTMKSFAVSASIVYPYMYTVV